MEGKNRRNRRSSGSSSVGVGIVAFLLGFLFAFIVLIGSIFGVGYVAVKTDINEVFRVFGLENVNESPESDDDKYNYINADQAPDILSLIQEIMKMANDGLGELNLNKIDALAPVTDAVLNMAFEYIDDVVDFDKDYFKDVPLTSIIDCVTNSMYYIRTSKVIDMLNDKMGYSINLDDIPIASYLINGVEAQYATIKGGDENYKLPVLFDYYVYDSDGIGYNRTIPVGGTSAYPKNLYVEGGGSLAEQYPYICETTSTNADGKTLYKVYYVPCKITGSGIEQAAYDVVEDEVVEDPNVSFTKNGEVTKLKYKFRTVEYGEDTVFIAVKPQSVNGQDTFVLDYDAIAADVTSCSYYAEYAKNYYSKAALRTEQDSDRMYGVSTINGINYFKNVAGEIVEYDPLTLSDIMLDAMGPLYQVPVSSLVGSDAEVVKGIFGDTSLGAILNNEVKFNELINKINLTTFLKDVDVTNKVMAFIVYNVSNVSDDGHGNYTAIYDKNGENKTVKLEVSDGKIKSVIDPESDKKLDGNTVADLTTLTLDLTLDIFLDVKADDAIMAYLGYGICDVVEKAGTYNGEPYAYVGECDNKTVLIFTDENGNIVKAVYEETGKEVKGTTIDEVSDRVNNITGVLTLPDVIKVDPSNAIMAYIGYGLTDVEEVTDAALTYKYTGTCDGNKVLIYVDNENYVTKVTDTDGGFVSGTAIDKVSNRVDNIMDVLTLPDFIDIDPDDAIMAYIGYGIYDVVAQNGTDGDKPYSHVGTYKQGTSEVTVYVSTKTVDDKTCVSSVWLADGGNKVKGTTIGNVSDRLNGITDAIAISEFIDIDATDAIMSYLGYGVYDVVEESGSGYTHTGLHDVNGVDTKVYIATDDSNGTPVITSVWYVQGGNKVAVSGTKIGNVADRLENISNVIAVTEFMGVDPTDAIMAYMGYGINNVVAEIGTDTLGNSYTYKAKYKDALNVEHDCYLTVNGDGEIDGIWYIEGGVKKTISGTKVGNVPDRINSVQNTLTISEIITVDDNSSMILKSLKNATIADLETEIDKVIIQRIYAKEIYGLAEDGDPALVTDATFNPAYLYFELVDGSYELVTNNCPAKPASAVEGSEEYKAWETAYDNALGKLTQEDWNSRGDKQYYTYGAAKGMWKLILYRVDGSTKTEKAYTINNFNNMVNSCAETVYNSTLGELQGAKIIGNDIDLSKKLKTVEVSGYTVTVRYLAVEDGTGNIVPVDTEAEGTPISGFTLKQLLVAITSML